MPYPKRAITALTALGLAAGATLFIVKNNGNEPTRDVEPGVSLGHTATVALTTSHDCSDLLAYYKREAERVVGPYGLNDGQILPVGAKMAFGTEMRAGAAPAAAAAQDSSAVPDSSTNVQVAGVDESDVVKTSGDL